MSHTVTWICPWCKRQYCSVEGSKFVQRGQYKRRKCRECLGGEAATSPAKTVAGDTALSRVANSG